MKKCHTIRVTGLSNILLACPGMEDLPHAILPQNESEHQGNTLKFGFDHVNHPPEKDFTESPWNFSRYQPRDGGTSTVSFHAAIMICHKYLAFKSALDPVRSNLTSSSPLGGVHGQDIV
jgi:hypothetical protein